MFLWKWCKVSQVLEIDQIVEKLSVYHPSGNRILEKNFANKNCVIFVCNFLYFTVLDELTPKEWKHCS